MEQKQKRKNAPTATTKSTGQNPRDAKRVKLNDARSIRVEPPLAALNEHNELDVAAFVKSHENEIKAMEHSMGLAKKGLSSRAFQSVPNAIRRRTGSHNVKKVPKRLRNRAAKEMREDNTPTVVSRRRKPSGKQRLRGAVAEEKAKNKEKEGAKEPTSGDEQPKEHRNGGELASPQITVPKFRKRQIHKSWLPTHVYHTKRAHMTDPKTPLWRFAIPLGPTEKSYRTTHRASTMRGCVAWDTSYMSCIAVSGDEKSLLGLLKCLSIPENQLTGKKGKKWTLGSRSWSGWVKERDNNQRLIAKVAVVWQCSAENTGRHNLLLRVHPSAFYQLWDELCKLAKMQRPILKVTDLRFEIGSIEVSGPSASETLFGVLSPSESVQATQEKWQTLGGVTNINSVPRNALLQLAISDPRLRKTHQITELLDTRLNQEELLELLVKWPFDNHQSEQSLLDPKCRSDACRLLPSQKTVNRRKAEAPPGQDASALSTDPQIPAILLASDATSGQNSAGSWTILLPWKCVLPVWYCLMHYPVSSGGNPRLGGLEQQRQLCFESGMPWFPGDFPGTKAGWEWELTEREKRKENWESRPKGKRVEWKSLNLGTEKKGELGKGWACDWERLLQAARTQEVGDDAEDSTSDSAVSPPLNLFQYSGSATSTPSSIDSTALATISFSLVGRGHATACARVYRLPTNDAALRSSWLALTSPSKLKNGSLSDAIHNRRKALAAALTNTDLDPDSIDSQPTASDANYPRVPGEEDLVGFVTSGNYNLGEGRATGIGNVLLARVINEPETNKKGNGKEAGANGLCIVRETGMSVGRLAKWQVV